MYKKLVAEAIVALEHSATEELDNKVKTMQLNGVDDIVSLGLGEPCFDTPESIKKAACDALMSGETKYQPTAGVFALRQAISRKFKIENNLDADPNHILVTAGGKFGIFLAFSTLLEEEDKVVLLDPAWVSYEAAAKLNGAEVIRIPTSAANGFVPDLDAVEKVMDDSVKIIVVNSPCNPTGVIFPKETIRSLARLADKYGALLMSDEVYEYQIYGEKSYSPGSEFDNVITINAFSKSFAMTGWRLGYVTAPESILEGMVKIYQHSTSSVTSFAQWGGIAALENIEARDAAGEMLKTYQKNRDLMLKFIDQSAYLSMEYRPEGAFYCFPSYKFDMGSVEMATMLLGDCHVATVPGVAFGQCGEGHLRLSYAAAKEDIIEAFNRMDELFKKLEK